MPSDTSDKYELKSVLAHCLLRFFCAFVLLFSGCFDQKTPPNEKPVPEKANAAPVSQDSTAVTHEPAVSGPSNSSSMQPALVDLSGSRSTQSRDFGSFTVKNKPAAVKNSDTGESELTQKIDRAIETELAPDQIVIDKPLFEGQEAKQAEQQLEEVENFDPEDYAQPELTPEQKLRMENLQKEANSSRTDSESFLKIANESGSSDPEGSEPPIPESELPEGALDPNSPNYDWKAALNAKPKPIDLGDPLVDNPDQLTRLHPSQNIWFDKQNKEVVLLGAVAQTRGSLELFACSGRVAKDVFGNIMPNGAKTHESVVAIDITPHLLHAALLAANAEPGRPVVFSPKFEPPTGEEIDVRVRWKDKNGQIQETQAGDWIVDEKTGKTFNEPFVFTGSLFMVNANSGKRMYMADVDGELICVSNFPSAVMDIPVESSSSDMARLYMANEKSIPERGSPVTLILRPVPNEKKP